MADMPGALHAKTYPPLSVRVDHREAGSAVLLALQRRLDCEVVIVHLPLGDYLLGGRFLFERKTMADLTASIVTGRLFDQALRLTRGSARAAIILEGTSRELLDNGMRWEAIQGALITVTVFCGVPLLRTRSPEETAQTMIFTAQQGRALALGALPRGGYRPRGKRARQMYILQGLPGIGPERARRLLDRFGSIERIVTASAEELRKARGIGNSTADRIRWAVKEQRCPYAASRLI